MNRVLIVEDKEVFAGQLEDMIVYHGYSADVAHTGEVAQKLLKKNKYDGIILDLDLGENSNIHGFGLLRNSIDLTKTPVIVVTAHVNNIPEILEFEVYAVFRKPVETLIVLHALKKAIYQHKIENKLRTIQNPPKSFPREFVFKILNLSLLTLSLILVLMKDSLSATLSVFIVVAIIVNMIGAERIYRIFIKSSDSEIEIETDNQHKNESK